MIDLVPKSHNKSGYIGVDWFPLTQKWRATVSLYGRKIHIGCFDKRENAYRASLEIRHLVLDNAPIQEIEKRILKYRSIIRNNPNTGVCFHQKSGKWIATFQWINIRYYCGVFETKKAAQLAVRKKRKELGMIKEVDTKFKPYIFHKATRAN